MVLISVHVEFVDDAVHWWADGPVGYYAVAESLDELKTLVYEAMEEFYDESRNDVRWILAEAEPEEERGSEVSSPGDTDEPSGGDRGDHASYVWSGSHSVAAA